MLWLAYSPRLWIPINVNFWLALCGIPTEQRAPFVPAE